ncbi:MAG: hypothetical protein KC468_32775, partial [Myxococcales bacterium]|nr:hypothetical protein [Myxococcales bacterium]
MTRPATPLLNDARARASRLRRALAQALYPPVCLGCRRLLRASGPHDHGRTEREVPLCSRCAPELVELPPEARVVDGVEAVFAHDGPLRRA